MCTVDDEDDEEETGRPPSTRVTPPRAERYGRRRSSKLKESGSEQVNERRRSSALKRRQSSLVMQVTGVLPSAQMKSTNVFLKYVQLSVHMNSSMIIAHARISLHMYRGIEGDSDDEVAGSMANVFSPFMRRGSREEGMEMGSNGRLMWL